MSRRFELITDSCCNLSEKTIAELGLHILSLSYMSDEQKQPYTSFENGKYADLKAFFAKMRDGVIYRTSLPNNDTSEQIFTRCLNEGRDILYLGFSSALSGTFEATDHLLESLKEKYPARKIISIDTLAASGGQGLIVWHCAKAADEGKSIEECASYVRELIPRLAHWFTVDDLVYLFRGGRVSRTSALAAGVLNIKPVMHVSDDGKLIPVEKVRGRKKSLNAMFKHLQESIVVADALEKIIITHGDCEQDANYLANLIRESYQVVDLEINILDPVIGAHAGPGTVALFFIAKSRN